MSDYYKLETAINGYEAGTELRNVTIKQARAMECNRCGGCCNGLLPDDVVTKDSVTGLPKFVWGDKFPPDLYESRYRQRLLQPIGFLDNSDEMPYQGRIGVVDKFEKDSDGKDYTCFTCSFHSMNEQNLAVCGLRESNPNPDPQKPEQVRPLYCGEFPVFGPGVDDEIINGHAFIPPTGTLPKCTWYGLRIVGPWRDSEYWKERWQLQQQGRQVADLHIPEDFVKGLEYKAEQRKKEQ